MKFDLKDGEKLIKQTVAALSRENMVDGELCLSSYRLQFRGIDLKLYWDHTLKELVSVSNHRGHISVEFDDGWQENIVLYNRDEWTKQILSAKSRWVPLTSSDTTESDSHLELARRALRDKLARHFDMSELATLCFEIDIDFDNMPGRNKDARIRELILFCERSGKLSELVNRCRELRSHVEWP
jgi:hypothetical protein